MGFLEQITKKIAERKDLIKVQEVKNNQLRAEIKKINQTVEEKEQQYKATLNGKLLDEIAQDKAQMQKLKEQLVYQEELLEDAKKEKIQSDLEAMCKDVKAQVGEIDLLGAVEAIEKAKQNYLDALIDATNKADEINKLFNAIKDKEAYLSLETQVELKKVWREALRVNLPKSIVKSRASGLEDVLYYRTNGYAVSFRGLEIQKEREANEKRKKDREEFERQAIINNKMYGRGKYDVY